MSSNSDRAVKSSLGPLARQPEVVNETVSTTPVLAFEPPEQTDFVMRAQWRAFKVTNVDDTNLIAWHLVTRGADAPTFSTTSEGVVILPGQVEYFTARGDQSLYVVASAASTSVNVVVSRE